jgi:hypothetical protein
MLAAVPEATATATAPLSQDYWKTILMPGKAVPLKTREARIQIMARQKMTFLPKG